MRRYGGRDPDEPAPQLVINDQTVVRGFFGRPQLEAAIHKTHIRLVTRLMRFAGRVTSRKAGIQSFFGFIALRSLSAREPNRSASGGCCCFAA